MATLDYRAGSVTPLGVRPLQPDGTPPDLTGAAMQVAGGGGGTANSGVYGSASHGGNGFAVLVFPSANANVVQA